jgi:triosephosphate isomerase
MYEEVNKKEKQLRGKRMKQIFVNLKRFEVSRKYGGVCDYDSPVKWYQDIFTKCIELGLGKKLDMEITFFLPEAFIITVVNRLNEYPVEDVKQFHIGSQSVHSEDIKVGKNFGAFTSLMPATAAKLLGCEWTMIGHSEERKNLLSTLERAEIFPNSAGKISNVVGGLLHDKICCATEAGLKVLYCIGETAEEKGTGTQVEQEIRIKDSLTQQLSDGLENLDLKENMIVIAYEPLWAIGPGKTPPNASYIDFVTKFIKEKSHDLYGVDLTVIYGGGLKEENANEIASVKNVSGGLIALTRFSGKIGFYPEDLAKIINEYLR